MISLQRTAGDKQLRAPGSVQQCLQMAVSYFKQEGFGSEAWGIAWSCVLVAEKNNYDEDTEGIAEYEV